MSRAREIADRDLAATELILDADNDTSITADTDDEIHFKVAGDDHVKIKGGTNVLHVIEGSSGQGTPHTNSGLVIESDGETGINILSGNANFAGIVFGDDGDNDIGFIQYKHDDNYLRFGTNTSEKMRIASDGDVTITDGDLIIGTSGHGIDFSATADGSSAGFSELFDDYEEGIYSVAITTGSSGTITLNGSYNDGYYTKIGRVVHVTADIRISSVSSPNGTTYISLPFTALNASAAVSSNAIMTVGITEQTNQRGPFFVRSLANTTTAEVFYDTTASLFTLQSQNAGFGSSDQISFTLTYMTE